MPVHSLIPFMNIMNIMNIMNMYIPLMNYVYAIFINYFSTQIKINNIKIIN
jgi:hypothetical protein